MVPTWNKYNFDTDTSGRCYSVKYRRDGYITVYDEETYSSTTTSWDGNYATTVTATASYSITKEEIEEFFKKLSNIEIIKKNNKELSKYYSKEKHLLFENPSHLNININRNIKQPPQFLRPKERIKKYRRYNKKRYSTSNTVK